MEIVILALSKSDEVTSLNTCKVNERHTLLSKIGKRNL